MERVLKENGSHESAATKRVVQGKFAPHFPQGDLASGINNSPQMIAQRKKLQGLFGGAAQLQGAEDEILQGKFHTAQRVEEEEPLQGKFETVQRVEEEEPLQGKFAAVQRVEEEEPLQGKFAPVASAQLKEETAAKPNNTGLPDNLKSGIESLSGLSMDNVKVHYNSSRPAQLNALAYAQGTDIHVAPGQERHLPHEAWHVVQQAQGRVRPTMQMKDGVAVNDDAGLEREADVVGGIAQREAEGGQVGGVRSNFLATGQVRQMYATKTVLASAQTHYGDGWGARYGITDDGTLRGRVPDAVTGTGSVQLGWFDAPEVEQDPDDRRFEKYCWIGYRDDRWNEDETVIYHCGPSGAPRWYDWP